ARRFSAFLLCCFSFFSVASVTVAPNEFTLHQPNGYSFKAKAKGNINHNWVETLAGKSIKKVGDSWFYLKLDSQNRSYVSSSKVGSLSPKAIELLPDAKTFPRPVVAARPALIKPKLKETILPSGQVVYSNIETISNTQAAVSSQNMLVLLVSFTDQSFKYDRASFDALMYGDSGVQAYFKASSYNNFELVRVAETQDVDNDGFVSVTLAMDHPNAKFGSVEMIQGAIGAADEFIDYASFDSDSNGTISAKELSIVMIVAGYEQSFSAEASASPRVWGHAASTTPVTHDGVSLAPYTMFGERHGNPSEEHQVTIGIIAHELGHLMLDLPDLYDTDQSSQGIGNWGLMGGGSWGQLEGEKSGTSPSGMLGWSKIKAGFTSATQISSAQSLSLAASSITSAYAQIWIDPYKINEYFLLENRTLSGVDAALPGKGLLITHIDNSQTTNANDAKRLVDIEDADNEMTFGDSGDTFPGTGDITEFSSTTTPSTANNAGEQSGVAVRNISESTSTVEIGSITPVSGLGDNISYNEGRNILAAFGYEKTSVWTALNVKNTTSFDQIKGVEVYLTGTAAVTFYLYDSVVNNALGTQLYKQSGFSGEKGWNRFLITTPQTLSADSSVVLVLEIVTSSDAATASANFGDSSPSGGSYVSETQDGHFADISTVLGDLNQHLLVASRVSGTDSDGDGIADSNDNCPSDSNPDQLNTDGADDGGDVCDNDDDNDNVLDVDDAFPLDASESVDTDGDGIGNNADTDDDNDGVLDTGDAFPLDATESVDTDGDGIGNNADTDDDGDGIPDTEDDNPLEPDTSAFNAANMDAGLVACITSLYSANVSALAVISLECPGLNIASLAGIEQFLNLKVLNLKDNQMTDFSPLTLLVKIDTLSLENTNLSDVSALRNMVNMKNLALKGNSISDIYPLENLVNITSLDLRINSIKNIAPLRNMVAMIELRLSKNPLNSLLALSSLSLLKDLTVSGGEFPSSDFLSIAPGLTSLEHVILRDNNITSIAGLELLTKLRYLKLRGNKIVNLGPLLKDEKLEDIIQIELTDNVVDHDQLQELIRKYPNNVV
ncbi:MAG: M6 family metalloprotease domain-containing protein, partial [Psychrosphaera sp.]|nr:M6 family metalloprotease domain-containing protein [Psychrosphaera sp.]